MLIAACALSAFLPYCRVAAGNGNGAPGDNFEGLAHRGVHFNWEKGTYDRATGCEAGHIFPPALPYIENTLESIEAAFSYGATIVEID